MPALFVFLNPTLPRLVLRLLVFTPIHLLAVLQVPAPPVERAVLVAETTMRIRSVGPKLNVADLTKLDHLHVTIKMFTHAMFVRSQSQKTMAAKPTAGSIHSGFVV